jgi:transcription elongation GreA/GreB family factor
MSGDALRGEGARVLALGAGRARRGVDVVGFAETLGAPKRSIQSKRSGSTIEFGATVTLIDEDAEAEKVFPIVGESEADVKSGKVSVSSAAVRARIGKQVGDSVEVNTSGGGKSYEFLNVDYI